MDKRIVTICALMMAACSAEPSSDAPDNGQVEEGFGPVVLHHEVEPRAIVFTQTDATRSIAKLGHATQFYSDRFEQTGAWLDASSAAEAEMASARLTGDVRSYVAAAEWLGRAFEASAEGTGPFLSRANYHATVHLIRLVGADLDQFETRIFLTDAERAALAGLRGDVAFHSGDLETARTLYEEAEGLDPTLASAGRLANLALRTAAYDEAQAWYVAAEGRVDAAVDPGAAAWARLHRGIVELERNDVSAAADHYRSAERMFGGWYLIEEHLAEAHLLLGDPQTAVAMYESIISRVPNGEFFAALGDTYSELSRDDDAQVAYANAADAFERDLAILPSAASGHALDFYLSHDPSRALDLAQANFETRPGHEARTKLAQALLATGDDATAIEVLTPTAQSAWATPDYLATAALVFAGHDPDLAADARQRAEATHPGAVDELRSTLGL